MAYENAVQSGNWKKWAEYNFFKTITKTGRELNENILASIAGKGKMFNMLAEKLHMDATELASAMRLNAQMFPE